MDINNIFARHKQIAFQLSGGKDSVAALFLLRPYWDQMVVYFCNSGDMKPELTSVVARLSTMLSRFVVVPGRVFSTHQEFGLPSDLVPFTSSYASHVHNAGSTLLLQDRVSCCFRSIMAPLHERMLHDSITMIIRGQKNNDVLKGCFKSGDVVDGIEFFYPVENWTDDECFDFCNHHGFDMRSVYSTGIPHSGDCITCTAWLGEDRAHYVRKHAPEKFNQYQSNIRKIGAAIAPVLNTFRAELEAVNGY
tara:strand:- start:4410 stop:5156 length:747 start_codon:yes stop_codon:yes gene_type:complete